MAQLENAVGAPVDPLRFRGNLYIQGWPAWREFEVLDQIVTIGTVRLSFDDDTVRFGNLAQQGRYDGYGD